MKRVSKEHIQCVFICVKVKTGQHRTRFWVFLEMCISVQNHKEKEENNYHNSQHTITTRKQMGGTSYPWEYWWHDCNSVGEALVEVHPENSIFSCT